MQPRFFAIVLLTRLFDAAYTWELIRRKTELTWHLWPPQIGITRRFSMPLLTLLLLLLFFILLWLRFRAWRRAVRFNRPTCNII